MRALTTTWTGVRARIGVGALLVLVGLVCALTAPASAFATTTATYVDSQTIPVPPASNFSGAGGGGDGWSVALSSTDLFNVFHHQPYLYINCHTQATAAACWSNYQTITDSGYNFATSGQPGMYLDQSTGNVYVFVTRWDNTGGVECIAPSSTGATSCGFTPLTATGEAPLNGPAGSGWSEISNPVQVGSNLYAFNYVNGTPNGTEDQLLCFSLATDSACAGQPYAVNFGGSNFLVPEPAPSISAFNGQIILPMIVTTVSGSVLGCYDPSTGGTCSGSWPVDTSANYAGNDGAVFPLLDTSGTTTGFCLPTGTDQCYGLDGGSVATPSGLTSVVTATDAWNGPALTLGPRVYVPNGNASGSGEVQCFDYSSDASCANFPMNFSNMGYLYTVTQDPQRPTCIWVNSDNGSAQIQDFDAYTGLQCGQGPVRALASQFVVSAPACTPGNYVSLQVTSPSPSSYTSGTVTFEDSDGNPIPGISPVALDSTGTADLSGLSLNSGNGLPEFLITLNGATASNVSVQLMWTGTYDPSCVGPTTTAVQGPVNTSLPSISGTPKDGNVLTADPGSWSISSTYAYQWYDCMGAAAGSVGSGCTEIPGATSSTYTVQPSDMGQSLEAAVSATGGGATSSAVDSPVTGPAVPGPAATVVVQMNPTAVYADGASQSTATATVSDNWGVPVPGDTVTFTSSGSNTIGGVTDHGDGTYSATVTSTATPGTVSIKATDTSSPLEPSGGTTLHQTPVAGPAANMSLSLSSASIHADGYSTSVATATVTDATGNPVLGDNVAIASTTGAGQVSAVTPGPQPGQYQATITSTTTAGAATITATDSSISPSLSQTATLTQTAGPATYVTVSPNPSSITAGGSTTSLLTATVTDYYGNPVSGDTVLITDSGTGAPSLGAVSPGISPGTYVATATPGTMAGAFTVTAQDTTAAPKPSGTTSLTQAAGPAANAALNLSPSSITADGRSTSMATVTVTDANGNAVSGDNVTITPGAVNGGAAPSVSSVSAGAGPGTYVATITSTTVAGTSSVAAQDTTQSVSATPQTLTQAPDKAAYVTLSLSPPSIIADGVTSTQATATVTDVNGNPISGDAVGFQSTGSQAIGSVSAGSQPGTYQATITSTKTAGTYTITAQDTTSSAQPSGTATLTQTAGQAVAGGGSGPVFWANYLGGSIGEANPDGTGVNENFITGASYPGGVATDGQYVYWTNLTSGTIGRAKLDGSDVNQDFITIPGGSIPLGIAVNGQHIFWTDNGGDTIGEANLDGSNPNDAFITVAGEPYELAINSQDIYWANYTGGTIGEADLDGSNVNQSLVSGINSPCGMAASDQYIYWGSCDFTTNTIGRAGADGSSPNYSFVSGATDVNGLAVSSQYIYWTDFGQNHSVGRANLDGTGANDTFITGALFPVGVATSGGQQLVLSPSSIVADGTSTSLATFTVEDANGNPVSGDSVSITSNGGQTITPVTPGPLPGTYQAWITSTITAGTSTITASDNSVSPAVTATATLTQTPGPAAYVTVAPISSITADGSSQTTATATVTDVFGNRVPGDNVSFSVSGSNGPTLGSAVGNGDGTYSVPVTASTTAGAYTITAADSSSPGDPSGSTSLSQVPGPASSVTLSLSPASIVADGHSTSTATATVTDQYGNPVSGDTVTIHSSGAQNVSSVTPGLSPGTYQATITSTATAGIAHMTATDTSSPSQPSQTVKLTQTTDEAAYVSVALRPASLTADGSSQTTATVKVTDVNGNPVSGNSVSITSNGAQNIGSVSVGSAPGTYQATITSSTRAGAYTIKATDSSSSGHPSGATSLAQMPGPASAVALSLSPASLVADGRSTSTATATVTDANGNPVSGDAITIASSGSQSVSSVTPGSAPGTYQATVTSTTTAGTATITATDTSVAPQISRTTQLSQVAGSGDDVSVALSPASIVANGSSTSTVTATVTDPNGNPVSGDQVTIVSSGAQHVGPVTAGSVPGTYQATITSTTTPGSATITATDSSVAEYPSGQTTLTQHTGAPAVVRLSLSHGSIDADGKSTTVAMVAVLDAHDNAISGDDVTVASSGGQQVSAVTPGNVPGTYLATITATGIPGAATITATDQGASATAQLTQKDVSSPTIQIEQPVDGGVYLQNQKVHAVYSCSEPYGRVVSCAGPNLDGALIDTTTVGSHGFTVTAIDSTGNLARMTVHYDVVARKAAKTSAVVYLAGMVQSRPGAISVSLACLSARGSCRGGLELKLTQITGLGSNEIGYHWVDLGSTHMRLKSGAVRVFQVKLNSLGQSMVGAGALPKVFITVHQKGRPSTIVLSS